MPLPGGGDALVGPGDAGGDFPGMPLDDLLLAPADEGSRSRSSSPQSDTDNEGYPLVGRRGLVGPDGEKEERWPGTFQIALICACAALEGADAMLLPSSMLGLQRGLGMTLTQVSSMSLAEAVTMSAAAPLWGTLADQNLMTRKAILAWGAAMQGLVVLLLSTASSFRSMIVLRIMNGAVLASLRPVANGMLADMVSEGLRGRAYGMITLSMNLGMCASSLICTPLSMQTIGGVAGWRVAYAIIALCSLILACSVARFGVEPQRESPMADQAATKGKPFLAMVDELSRLREYFKMPSFCVLIAQGVVGCVPWNAMGYQTLFFQLSGMSAMQASGLQAVSQISCAAGCLLGGFVGDRFASWSRFHGRPMVAQISVLSGIPIAWRTFMCYPEPGYALPFYLPLVVSLGILATWCAAGVNLPILSEIVPADRRSSVMAWETALEGSSAAVFGNAAVGLLAQNVFGYDIGAVMEAGTDQLDHKVIEALGKALTCTTVLPWLLCFVFFTFLHWSYPADLARLAAAKMQGPKELRLESLP